VCICEADKRMEEHHTIRSSCCIGWLNSRCVCDQRQYGSRSGSNGELYVFVEPQSGWANTTETAKLTTSDGSHLNSVAISGNTIISGSPTATVGGRQSQGAVYIFVEPTGGWIDAAQDAILTASDGQAGDNFGNAVVIEGTTALVGAYNASTGGFGVQGLRIFSLCQLKGGVIQPKPPSSLLQMGHPTRHSAGRFRLMGKQRSLEHPLPWMRMMSGEARFTFSPNPQAGGLLGTKLQN